LDGTVNQDWLQIEVSCDLVRKIACANPLEYDFGSYPGTCDDRLAKAKIGIDNDRQPSPQGPPSLDPAFGVFQLIQKRRKYLIPGCHPLAPANLEQDSVLFNEDISPASLEPLRCKRSLHAKNFTTVFYNRPDLGEEEPNLFQSGNGDYLNKVDKGSTPASARAWSNRRL
jgi:hypothetical protein